MIEIERVVGIIFFSGVLVITAAYVVWALRVRR